MPVFVAGPVNPTWTLSSPAGVAVAMATFTPTVRAVGTTYYVSTVGNDSNLGTIGAPWRTLNYAGTKLAPGDTVLVRTGTYDELVDGANFPNGTDWTPGSGAITIQAYPGEGVWLIPTSTAYAAVLSLVTKAYHIWDGIRVDGIHNTTVGAPNVQIDACDHIRIANSQNVSAACSGIRIQQTTAPSTFIQVSMGSITGGGRLGVSSTEAPNGIFVDGAVACAAATDHQCLFENLVINGFTQATYTSGIMALGPGANADQLGGITIRGCQISGNSQGVLLTNAVTVPNLLYNNRVFGNTYAGIMLYQQDASRLYNNTIHGNGQWGVDVGTADLATPILINNSISNNVAGPIVIQNASGSSLVTASYNNLNGNGNSNAVLDHNSLSTITTTTTVAPGYVNAGAGDFSLTTGSGLRDIGLTLAVVATDALGVARPQGTGYDIGACEYVQVGVALAGLATTVRGGTLAPRGDLSVALTGRTVAARAGVFGVSGGNSPATKLAATQCRAGLARSGLERSAYFAKVNVIVVLNNVTGVPIQGSVITESLRITQALNDQPDTCTFTLKPGATLPTVGMPITIYLGALNNPIFGGQVIRVIHRRRVMPGVLQAPFVDVECADWLPLFDRKLITRVYTGYSATAIATDIVQVSGELEFTTANIAPNLPVIPYFVLTHERPSAALRRLVNLMGGGGFYIDPFRDVHLFPAAGETGIGAPTPPPTLTNTLGSLHSFTHSYDLSQLRNRVTVEAQSAAAALTVPVGAFPLNATYPTIPVDDYRPFAFYGGTVRMGTETLTFVTRLVAATDWGYAGGATVTAPAAVGASSIAVSSTNLVLTSQAEAFTQTDFWVQIGDQVVFVAATDPGFLRFLPPSGYGSLTRALAVGEAVVGLSSLYHVSPTALEHPIQTPITVTVTVDDAASQAAMVALEGGDGVHENVISDSRLDITGAGDRAAQDVSQFSAPGGLLTVDYDSDAMTVVVGARQTVALTTTDVLATALTITQVDLTFPVLLRRPDRHATATAVTLAQLPDLTLTENT